MLLEFGRSREREKRFFLIFTHNDVDDVLNKIPLDFG